MKLMENVNDYIQWKHNYKKEENHHYEQTDLLATKKQTMMME